MYIYLTSIKTDFIKQETIGKLTLSLFIEIFKIIKNLVFILIINIIIKTSISIIIVILCISYSKHFTINLFTTITRIISYCVKITTICYIK